jgi:3-oxoacyl-[acyl-carrier-protein] synthase-1
MSTMGLIAGVGMSTPLGIDARQSSLVLRGRKLSPGKTGFRDRRGNAVGDVRAIRIDEACKGRERLLELARPALAEATRGIGAAKGPIPLFLSLPSRRTEEEEPLGPDFLDVLGKRAGVPIALAASEAVVLGHAGFAVALGRGLAALSARGASPCVVVGGVDSHHDPAVLAALDKERRLQADGVWNGFIPSEAAAFVVLAREGAAPALARVMAVATGMEREDGTEIGEAATEVALRVAGVMRAPVPWVLPDVNGERHRVKEWSFVRIRNREAFDEARTIETRLYDELGDVGAASGAVHAAYACMAFRLGFSPAPEVLVTLASEGPARGAFALGAP